MASWLSGNLNFKNHENIRPQSRKGACGTDRKKLGQACWKSSLSRKAETRQQIIEKRGFTQSSRCHGMSGKVSRCKVATDVVRLL